MSKGKLKFSFFKFGGHVSYCHGLAQQHMGKHDDAVILNKS